MSDHAKREHTHVESEAKNLIATGILSGEFSTHTIKNMEPADFILVPCPFIIECIENGQGCADCLIPPLASRADAAARGWTDIEFQPLSLGSSYYGLCPDCAKKGS